jgi:hypothetical protein
MRHKAFTWVIICLAGGLFAMVGAQTAGSAESEPAAPEQKSMGDVAKQLNNPVADLWALNFQLNRYLFTGGGDGQDPRTGFDELPACLAHPPDQ